MATWDKNTILLAASEVKEGDSPLSNPLTEQWLYKFGEGWTSLGPIGNSELYFKISKVEGDIQTVVNTFVYSNSSCIS